MKNTKQHNISTINIGCEIDAIDKAGKLLPGMINVINSKAGNLLALETITHNLHELNKFSLYLPADKKFLLLKCNKHLNKVKQGLEKRTPTKEFLTERVRFTEMTERVSTRLCEGWLYTGASSVRASGGQGNTLLAFERPIVA